jgi:hypothetical protein
MTPVKVSAAAVDGEFNACNVGGVVGDELSCGCKTDPARAARDNDNLVHESSPFPAHRFWYEWKM